MILILSHPDDIHAAAVIRELDRLGAAHYLWDLSQFPRQQAVSFRYDGTTAPAFVLHPDRAMPQQYLDLNSITAAWWRRPQSFVLDAAVSNPEHQTFAYNECQEALTGLWQSLDALWINNPVCDDIAHRKSWQLKLAVDVGLRTPQTLVSNDPDTARAFLTATPGKQFIYKPFSATTKAWRETRLVSDAELGQLDKLRHAPVIFQEYIAGIDYRVTVVGQEVFTAAIDARGGAYPVDFRMNLQQLPARAATLPDDVQARLLALAARLGIVYGAADFRQCSATGQFYFLEINPAGQWLFVEDQTGLPISAAIAGALVRGG
jgi:glutathione synthase/RimK-type ligase-like ATP-grasp enzyme